ncbi:hypothetical protein, partial [Actinoallomurus acaciae]
LLAHSQVITLHARVTPETTGMIGAELGRLTATLAPAERERFRATMAGIIQRRPAAHDAGRR